MDDDKVRKLRLFDSPSEDRFMINLYGDVKKYFLSKKKIAELLEENVVNYFKVVKPDNKVVPVVFNSSHVQYYPKEPNREKALRHLDLIPVTESSIVVEAPIIYQNKHLIKVGVHKELISSLNFKVDQPLKILKKLRRIVVNLLDHLREKRIITIQDITLGMSKLTCTPVLPSNTVVYKLNLSSKERKALHQKWLLQNR